MTSEFFNVRRIAVVSDTHGHIPGGLVADLKPMDLIIHAGDMDAPDILKTLHTAAPVVAVRGNMDRGTWTDAILPAELISINGIFFYILHDLSKLDVNPEAMGVKVVISGHTHRPGMEKKKEVIYLNPGSPTQPRGGFSPSFAVITLNGRTMDVRIKTIHVES